MPSYDERTPSGWPLPFRSNTLEFDVERLRESFLAVDEALQLLKEKFRELLDEKFYGLEEKQYILDARMDVIAGQTTEDSEILDARVDTQGVTHPNVGDHIRSVQEALSEVVVDLANLERQTGRSLEVMGQQALNTRMRLDAEITARTDEDTAIRQELVHEVLTRAEQDDGFQKQIDSAAEAIMRTVVNLRELSERRKISLSREESARISADDSLQAEINALAEALLRDSVNLYEALERRKEALKQEIQARIAGDAALQEQIQQESEQRAGSDAEIHEALDVLDEGVALRKSEIESEAQARVEGDEGLARQVNANAEAVLRTTITVQDLNARRKADLTREEQARIAHDEDLQRQVDKTAEAALENSLGIQHEAEQRRKSDERIEALKDESSRQSDIDAHHQRQIDSAVLAILQNTLTLSETLALHREALLREEHSRYEEDANQQAQTDTNALANMRNSLNIQQEAEQRRKVLERLNELRQETQLQIQILRNEMGLLYEIPLPGLYEQLSGLQAQANQNAEAGIWNTLNLSREAEHRRELSEVLSEADTYHQRQIDALIRAILENSVNLHREVARRVDAIRRERITRFEEDTALRDEINTVAEAVMRNMLALNDALSHQREAQSQEARTRAEEDAHLQTQADTNAIAAMELAANLSNEAEKRRELSQVVAGIKSPVDWSRAESLAIPEPRCAVVNFTGLASMPTSKTADISAVLEFWDMQGNYFKKPIVCSAQGSSSMGFVKKNVKVDLLNDDGSEFELKIGNWVEQDGFHLKAYYTDFFRGVGAVCYKLWEEIMETKPYRRALVDTANMNTTATGAGNISDLTLQLDTGALCHPDGFPCIVYLNGDFYGVFSWQLKKHRKNYHMDKSPVEQIHLDGSLLRDAFWSNAINWAAFEIRNPNKLYTMDGKKYDGDVPRELIDETSEKYDPDNKDHVRSAKVKKSIQSLTQRFMDFRALYTQYTSSRTEEKLAELKAAYEELFDWENQRDYLIFMDIIQDGDGFGKNWQWTTYDGVKWYVNAYDLDGVFGAYHLGDRLSAPHTGHMAAALNCPTYYAALLYQSELEARYRKLREAGIIDADHITAKLTDWTARIGEQNYELEYERWPNSPCLVSFNDSVDRVRKWLTVEIANMDKVYRYSPSDSQPATIEETDETESLIRAEQDAGILKQVDSLAEANMHGVLNYAATNEERRREEEQERQTRHYEDIGILRQVNAIAEANMWRLVNEHESRLAISEAMQQIKELPSRPATDDEFNEMLDELYNNP